MVASPEENPSRAASARPFWRAATISVSDSTGTRISSMPANAVMVGDKPFALGMYGSYLIAAGCIIPCRAAWRSKRGARLRARFSAARPAKSPDLTQAFSCPSLRWTPRSDIGTHLLPGSSVALSQYGSRARGGRVLMAAPVSCVPARLDRRFGEPRTPEITGVLGTETPESSWGLGRDSQAGSGVAPAVAMGSARPSTNQVQARLIREPRRHVSPKHAGASQPRWAQRCFERDHYPRGLSG